VFVLARPEQVASAYLHFRSGSRRTYQRTLLAREHEIYLRGTVPAEVVRAPGVEYFVEISTPRGDAGLALGSPETPVRVAVKPPPFTQRFGDQAGRTTVRVAGEHLDFATFDHRRGSRTDRMTIGTIDVSYELGTAVQRVGVGAGAIIGSGGYSDAVWQMGTVLPRAGFNYGRADVELGRPTLAVGISGIAGVGKEGLSLGIEGRMRVGALRSTNLQLLAQSLPELGWFADTRLGARPARDFLLGISVGATDQPNNGDVGAKLGTELEWLGIPGAILRVRASWQGRSVAHGGIGGGAAVELTW
jgi:hypothetical protein